MCGQLPPNQRRSMTATVAPRSQASYAAASPARTGADDHEVERFHRGQCGGVEAMPVRWRTASKSSTAAAIETFRLSATPAIGIETALDARSSPGRPEAPRPRCRGRSPSGP